MDRRQLLQGLIGLSVVTATPKVVSDGLELITSASGEEKKPKTVDDILVGTSFQNVCSSDYSQKTKYGNVVVFFYDDSMGGDNYSTRLAQVYDKVEPSFRDKVNFLKYFNIRNDTFAVRLGVTTIPYTLFYRNGQIVDRLAGGPKEDFRVNVWVENFRKALNKLYK